MKTIGLIGGLGWEASAAYYRIMNRRIRAELGGWHSARVILDSLDMHPVATAKRKADYEVVRDTLVASATRLQAAGADVIVIACNTVHRFAGSVREATSIPLLHIADVAGRALAEDGHVRVGLLGTQATMQATFYTELLSLDYGATVLVPPLEQRTALGALIANELTTGEDPTAVAPQLDPMIRDFADQGCTAVLLACTDFGVAFGATDARIIERGLPLYDTSVIHAEAAVRFALARHVAA